MPISVAEWDVDPEPLFGKGVFQWPLSLLCVRGQEIPSPDRQGEIDLLF